MTVHEEPATRVPPQEPGFKANALAPLPIRATPLTVNEVVPVFVRVTACGAALEFVTVCGNDSNFARVHKTLRITPAMAAGISDHVWSYEEIAALAA